MPEKIEPDSPSSGGLTQKNILIYWLPLAASWLLMASEMPFITSVLARLSEAELIIASFGIVAVISITIESPVISLLSTSTALARTWDDYLVLRRFTLHLIAATTLLHILMGWTPLFDLVVDDLMGAPASMHFHIKIGMQLMVFWSGAIAWRRFKQGILIRYGYTRYVGQGTFIRLIGSAGAAYILGYSIQLPGIMVATIALEIGVIAEAIYAHFVANKVIMEHLSPTKTQSGSTAITYRELVNFHWPLAATNLLFLLTRPLITASLARGPNPERDLAAWPVTMGILFITRSVTLALPEVVIALNDRDDDQQLVKFCRSVGLVCMSILAVVSFTPLSRFYFETMIGIDRELASLAVVGAKIGVFLPLVMSMVSYYRGALTARKATKPITLGMITEIISLGLILVIGFKLQVPGIMLAAIAIVFATFVDAITLFSTSKKALASA